MENGKWKIVNCGQLSFQYTFDTNSGNYLFEFAI